jgi:hypothetical protein
MCDKKTSSIVHAQQASVERVAELMTTAETELAAFLRGSVQAIWPEGSEERRAGLGR